MDINLTTGIYPTTQLPLDSKCYFKTLQDLNDLGENNFKAFVYYDNLIAVCLEDQKLYVWKEQTSNVNVDSRMSTFQYPAGSISNGIDYSEKTYGWFLYYDSNKTSIDSSDKILNGSIAWLENYDFKSTPFSYKLNGIDFRSPATVLTISPSDPSLDRIDIFILNTENKISIKEGTPSLIPLKPLVNYENEIEVSSLFVKAGTTTPVDYSLETVFNENLGQSNEWNASVSNNSVETQPITQTVLFNSTENPSNGTLSINASNVTKNDLLVFERVEAIKISDFNSLAFDFESKAKQAYSCTIKLYEQNTLRRTLTINPDEYGFDPRNIGSYSLSNIPFTDFQGVTKGGTFDKITLTFTPLAPKANSITGFYIDNIRLVKGVDNTPTINSYFNLNEVSEENFDGAEGYAVTVENNSLVFKQQIPKTSDTQDKHISGNVYWTGTGYVYKSSEIQYVLQGVLRRAPATTITLDAPDADPRWDVFVVNLNNELVVVKGTPAPSPQEAVLDPVSQIRISSVLVNTGTTEPTGVSKKKIFDENLGETTEWTGSTRSATNYSIPANEVVFDSIDFPKTGTKHIKTHQISNATVISFLDNTTSDIENLSSLNLSVLRYEEVKQMRAFSINIYVYNSSVLIAQAIVKNGENGLNSTEYKTYSNVSVPSSKFTRTAKGNLYNKVEFVITPEGKEPTNYVPPSLYIDDIFLTEGEDVPKTDNSFLNLNDVYVASYKENLNHSIKIGENGEGLVAVDERRKLNEASVSGSHDIDWGGFEAHILTMTANTTFTETNLPTTGEVDVITIYLTGAFTPTFPAAWNVDVASYSGAVWNRITIDYVKPGFYSSIISEK